MREMTNYIADAGCITAPRVTSQQENWTATASSSGVFDFGSVLLAIAGHDLRQPLQMLQSANELLGVGLRTSSELKYLRSSQDAIDRLGDLLAQLLTALRIREHTKGMMVTPVRIQQVTQQACQENEESALRKGVSLRLVSSNATIMSDRLLLTAAVRNIVSNAVKYTEPGGRILVGCRRIGSNLRIDVLDTGIGIPSEKLDKIFDAFTRLDTIRREGLGVGLFIVRHALGLLGHRMEVASTLSRGSRFSISTSVADRPDLDPPQ